ncbi:hypothetical protein CERZMDRAFT_94540 [Cercospora zeae-maydis SCOH1-5]|uniref:Uncharacterized protein n=1 Tax=Cercospora zeae-maydis SCOH1-5 TaxID=717836 RepID=A0A6A6FNU6_9PEZI|nr:hypothetical protein CERZMDRAFT_94540 [Cercospora zeae-maydis SCOH1-5]
MFYRKHKFESGPRFHSDMSGWHEKVNWAQHHLQVPIAIRRTLDTLIDVTNSIPKLKTEDAKGKNNDHSTKSASSSKPGTSTSTSKAKSSTTKSTSETITTTSKPTIISNSESSKGLMVCAQTGAKRICSYQKAGIKIWVDTLQLVYEYYWDAPDSQKGHSVPVQTLKRREDASATSAPSATALSCRVITSSSSSTVRSSSFSSSTSLSSSKATKASTESTSSTQSEIKAGDDNASHTNENHHYCNVRQVQTASDILSPHHNSPCNMDDAPDHHNSLGRAGGFLKYRCAVDGEARTSVSTSRLPSSESTATSTKPSSAAQPPQPAPPAPSPTPSGCEVNARSLQLRLYLKEMKAKSPADSKDQNAKTAAKTQETSSVDVGDIPAEQEQHRD